MQLTASSTSHALSSPRVCLRVCVCVCCVFSLLSAVDVQGCVQSIRKLLLDCLSLLFAAQPLVACSDSSALLSAFIAAVDGEKDPRCLVVVFDLAAFLLRQCDDAAVAACSDALFDVLGCYFPITFTPPSNDPHHITQMELKQALRRALTAHPSLNAQLIPLLLDKCDDTMSDVRLDALLTLHAALTASGSGVRASAAPFLQDLVSAIKRSWIAGNEPDVQRQLALVLTATVALLCPDDDAGGRELLESDGLSSSLLSDFRSALFGELVEEMRVPDSKVARAYADMTRPICAASGQHALALL